MRKPILKTNSKHIFWLGGALAFALLGGFFALGYGFLPAFSAINYDSAVLNVKKLMVEEKPKIMHLPTPEPLKSIYMSACVVGTPSLRNNLVKLIEETELNALVIDVKDYSGTLSYKPENLVLMPAWQASKCGAQDMREFLQTLKEKNIYSIARVTVFQDPFYAKLHPELAVQSAATQSPWKDRKGLNFLDVGGKPTWDYIMAIARDAHQIGFDEINFDYIRYPSDGNMKDAVYKLSTGSKQDQLEKFFAYLATEMRKDKIVTSADLFGMTTTNTDDLNIGQVLEKSLPYFDYIAPMVYPSHYPPKFNGWANPNNNIYDLIHFVMKRGGERAVATTTIIKTIGSTALASTSPQLYTKQSYPRTNLRTWIQDFDYGGNYDVAEVKAQIQATYDVGLTSWMIWSPSNKYTAGALKPEN